MPWRDTWWAASPVMSAPSNETLPLVGVYMPVTQLNSVVLPAPLGPISEVIEPGAMLNETLSSAVMPWKRIVSEATSSSGAVVVMRELRRLACWRVAPRGRTLSSRRCGPPRPPAR